MQGPEGSGARGSQPMPRRAVSLAFSWSPRRLALLGKHRGDATAPTLEGGGGAFPWSPHRLAPLGRLRGGATVFTGEGGGGAPAETSPVGLRKGRTASGAGALAVAGAGTVAVAGAGTVAVAGAGTVAVAGAGTVAVAGAGTMAVGGAVSGAGTETETDRVAGGGAALGGARDAGALGALQRAQSDPPKCREEHSRGASLPRGYKAGEEEQGEEERGAVAWGEVEEGEEGNGKESEGCKPTEGSEKSEESEERGEERDAWWDDGGRQPLGYFLSAPAVGRGRGSDSEGVSPSIGCLSGAQGPKGGCEISPAQSSELEFLDPQSSSDNDSSAPSEQEHHARGTPPCAPEEASSEDSEEGDVSVADDVTSKGAPEEASEGPSQPGDSSQTSAGSARAAPIPATSPVADPPVAPKVAGLVTGPVTGRVRGSVPGRVTRSLSGPLTGPMAGRVTDPVTGSVTGSLTGPVTGSVTGSVTGPVTGSVTGSLTGPVTGSVTGSVTGPVTGSVTGSVTGPVTGSVTGVPLRDGPLQSTSPRACLSSFSSSTEAAPALQRNLGSPHLLAAVAGGLSEGEGGGGTGGGGEDEGEGEGEGDEGEAASEESDTVSFVSIDQTWSTPELSAPPTPTSITLPTSTDTSSDRGIGDGILGRATSFGSGILKNRPGGVGGIFQRFQRRRRLGSSSPPYPPSYEEGGEGKGGGSEVLRKASSHREGTGDRVEGLRRTTCHREMRTGTWHDVHGAPAAHRAGALRRPPQGAPLLLPPAPALEGDCRAEGGATSAASLTAYAAHLAPSPPPDAGAAGDGIGAPGVHQPSLVVECRAAGEGTGVPPVHRTCLVVRYGAFSDAGRISVSILEGRLRKLRDMRGELEALLSEWFRGERGIVPYTKPFRAPEAYDRGFRVPETGAVLSLVIKTVLQGAVARGGAPGGVGRRGVGRGRGGRGGRAGARGAVPNWAALCLGLSVEGMTSRNGGVPRPFSAVSEVLFPLQGTAGSAAAMQGAGGGGGGGEGGDADTLNLDAFALHSMSAGYRTLAGLSGSRSAYPCPVAHPSSVVHPTSTQDYSSPCAASGSITDGPLTVWARPVGYPVVYPRSLPTATVGATCISGEQSHGRLEGPVTPAGCTLDAPRKLPLATAREGRGSGEGATRKGTGHVTFSAPLEAPEGAATGPGEGLSRSSSEPLGMPLPQLGWHKGTPTGSSGTPAKPSAAAAQSQLQSQPQSQPQLQSQPQSQSQLQSLGRSHAQLPGVPLSFPPLGQEDRWRAGPGCMFPERSFTVCESSFSAPTLSFSAPTLSFSAPTLSFSAPTLSFSAPTLSLSAPTLSFSATRSATNLNLGAAGLSVRSLSPPHDLVRQGAGPWRTGGRAGPQRTVSATAAEEGTWRPELLPSGPLLSCGTPTGYPSGVPGAQSGEEGSGEEGSERSSQSPLGGPPRAPFWLPLKQTSQQSPLGSERGGSWDRSSVGSKAESHSGACAGGVDSLAVRRDSLSGSGDSLVVRGGSLSGREDSLSGRGDSLAWRGDSLSLGEALGKVVVTPTGPLDTLSVVYCGRTICEFAPGEETYAEQSGDEKLDAHIDRIIGLACELYHSSYC